MLRGSNINKMEASEEIQLFARPKKKARKAAAGLPDAGAAGPKKSKEQKHEQKNEVKKSEEPQHAEQQQTGVRQQEEEAGPGPSSTAAALQAESFKELGLSEWLCQVTKTLGMQRPTQVQAGCIPAILAGKDVIGLAQTGSGKTAAFALPILQKLAKDPYGIFAVVLTPTRSGCAWCAVCRGMLRRITLLSNLLAASLHVPLADMLTFLILPCFRELAIQIAEQFRALGAGMSLRDSTIIGGMDMQAQARELSRRPHVVVATPGRLKVSSTGIGALGLCTRPTPTAGLYSCLPWAPSR